MPLYFLKEPRFPHWCSHSRDSSGRRVLIGLTFSETHEFELLDAEPPIDEQGYVLRWETDDESFPPSQARWLALFKRHRAACIRLGVTGPEF